MQFHSRKRERFPNELSVSMMAENIGTKPFFRIPLSNLHNFRNRIRNHVSENFDHDGLVKKMISFPIKLYFLLPTLRNRLTHQRKVNVPECLWPECFDVIIPLNHEAKRGELTRP